MIGILYFDLHRDDCFTDCLLETTTGSWYLIRFCIGFNIWCKLDIFTVYFLIWQFMSLMNNWDKQYLPVFSINLYRGWLCLTTALIAFLYYDAIFRYLPSWMCFVYLWITSVRDM